MNYHHNHFTGDKREMEEYMGLSRVVVGQNNISQAT
jgi:hypothetical protein